MSQKSFSDGLSVCDGFSNTENLDILQLVNMATKKAGLTIILRSLDFPIVYMVGQKGIVEEDVLLKHVAKIVIQYSRLGLSVILSSAN